MLFLPLTVWADSAITSKLATGELSRGAFTVNARFAIRLNATLEDALQQGVPLTFRLDFYLTRPRVYSYWRQLATWFEPTASQQYKLSYHSLSGQFRVSAGSLYLNFPRLDDALMVIGATRGWQVLTASQVGSTSVTDFAGNLRLRLDTTQLPLPFQLNILKSSEWALDSGMVPLNVLETDAKP